MEKEEKKEPLRFVGCLRLTAGRNEIVRRSAAGREKSKEKDWGKLRTTSRRTIALNKTTTGLLLRKKEESGIGEECPR